MGIYNMSISSFICICIYPNTIQYINTCIYGLHVCVYILCVLHVPALLEQSWTAAGDEVEPACSGNGVTMSTGDGGVRHTHKCTHTTDRVQTHLCTLIHQKNLKVFSK